MNILSTIDFRQPVYQVAIAISLVLIIGLIVFAIVYSILTGTPLNSAISNLIAFLLGGGVTATGGQLAVSHYIRGASSTNTSGPANGPTTGTST